jgi:DNA repair protein RadD
MPSIALRDYQVRAVHAVFAKWREGHKSVVLVAPTGMGKRIIALWLMEYAAEAGRRVLFVGNRRLLVTQAQNDAHKYGLDHGVIMADAEAGNAASTNQLASIQSLESWYFYESFSSIPTGRGLPPAELLIVDEGHQDLERYRQLLAFYPDAKVLILTATPVGAEGRALVPQPYQVLVEPVKNSELIQRFLDTGGPEGLLPTRVFAPSEPNIEGVKIVKGQEYNQAQLGRRVHECTVFADVFGEWHRHAHDRATVVFVPGIPFGRDLVRQFNFLLGDGAAHLIEAKTKNYEREEIFDRIKCGGARLLVSCDVLREGFDLPVLSCGIDLQPNSQLRSYWQKLGRIKRPYQDQSQALWLDFAGNYWRFLHPNQDPTWPEGEETTQEALAKSRKDKGEPAPIMCPKCMFVRERGPTCPNCGHVAGELIRRIRMGDGRLEEIPVREKVHKEKSEDDKLLAKWHGKLYGAVHKGWTYKQASLMFHRETGQWPREGWPFVFGKDSVYWTDKPIDKFPTISKLANALRRRT